MTEGSWQHFLNWLTYEPATGLTVDLSQMNLRQSEVDGLSASLDAAIAAMARLEGGAIANPDEHRMVGHYWLRAPELAPNPSIRDEIERTVEHVQTFAQAVHRGEIATVNGKPFEACLCLGIGGSALGPQFVADALSEPSDQLIPEFIDNTDPDGIARILARIGQRLPRTLVIVISKSGGTAETRNAMLEVRAAFARAGAPFSRNAVAITGADSALDQLADAEGWLERFPMWDWVGGRVSLTSAVGLLPAALQGIDSGSLLAGAKAMDIATRRPRLRDNPAAMLALAWYLAGDGKGNKAKVVLPYKDRLVLFSRYLQQLVMESLGKAEDLKGRQVRQGLVVYGNKGSTDQHAYVQQLRDGRNDFFATFVEVLESEVADEVEVEQGVTSADYLSGFLHGTKRALTQAGRQSLTITLPRVDAHSIGALVALYERAVGLYAGLININAYHQPGVEAGKRAAGDWLSAQRELLAALSDQPCPLTELAQQIGAPADTVYHLARHLAANRPQVLLEGDLADPTALSLRRGD